MRRYNKGWTQESERHSLAARSVKTGRKKSAAESFAKFGSVAWQNEMLDKIGAKLRRGERLDDCEKTFMQMQSEHALKASGHMAQGFIDVAPFPVVSTRDFFVRRFGRQPEEDLAYFREWEERFASGTPQAFMDSKSLLVYKTLQKEKAGLLAKGKAIEGFVTNADDKMHEKAFGKDEERVSGSLTPVKVDYLIKDEAKATKDYKGLGLESLSHDEARHEYLLKKLRKENKDKISNKKRGEKYA